MSLAEKIAARRLIALVPLELKDAVDPFASVAAAAGIAADCGATVDALVLGNSPHDEDAAAALEAGAARVCLATHPQLAGWGDSDQLVAAFTQALLLPELDAASALLSLLPAGAICEEIAARLAMRLQGVPLGRCTTIRLTEEGIAVTRPTYGGRAQATLLASEGLCFATMQFTPGILAPIPTFPRTQGKETKDAGAPTSAFPRTQGKETEDAAPIPTFPRTQGKETKNPSDPLPCSAGEGWGGGSRRQQLERSDGGRQNVTRLELNRPLPSTDHITRKDIGERLAPVEGAKVVVCGGRGIGSAEGFVLLQNLATALGGALGGSLQAVDAGWIPVARQVGQSGKYVTAELYIGVGVSGTPQHMAGVGSNTRIVGINNDPGADIFRFAEIGIVADWKEVIPALIEKLQPTAGKVL